MQHLPGDSEGFGSSGDVKADFGEDVLLDDLAGMDGQEVVLHKPAVIKADFRQGCLPMPRLWLAV